MNIRISVVAMMMIADVDMMSMMMVIHLRIEKAKAAARLFLLLHKLKLLSEKRYDKLIDYLTVKSLEYQLKEKIHDKPFEDR